MLARQRSRVCPTHNKPYCQCKCAKCKHVLRYHERVYYTAMVLVHVHVHLLFKVVLMYMLIVNIANLKRISSNSFIPEAKTCIPHKNIILLWDICCFSIACDHKKKVTITLLQADVDEIKQEYDSRHTNSAYTIICNFAALNHSKLWRENLSVSIMNKISSLRWLINNVIFVECS